MIKQLIKDRKKTSDSQTIAYLKEKNDTENEFRKQELKLSCHEIQNTKQ